MTAIIAITTLFLTLALSGFIGYPLARFLAAEPEGDPNAHGRRIALMAPILGFSLLTMAVFLVCLGLDTGTRHVALPTTVVLVAASCIAITAGHAWPEFKRQHWPMLAVSAPVFLLATFHVLWPVIAGWWTFAYATGDDGARWLMVVSHFQDEPWKYFVKTDSSLFFRMRERPLYLFAGAGLASLFGLGAPLAYTVMTAFSAMLSAMAVCLLFESFFPALAGRWRWMLWFQVSVFTGFAGLLPNMLYTGFSTHHFSVYPVVASLAFLAVRDKLSHRWIWMSFWGIMLGGWYTVRYSVLFMGIAGIMLLALLAARRMSALSFWKNVGALALAVPMTVMANWNEVRQLARSIDWNLVGLGVTLQKSPTFYGGDWTPVEYLLKLVGFMSIWENYEMAPWWFQLPSVLAVIVAFAGAAWLSFRRFRIDAAGYSGLLIANVLFTVALVYFGLSFVRFKVALYWPFFVMVGCLAGAFVLRETTRRWARLAGFLLLLAFPAITLGSARLVYFYWQVVDQRYTKVDDAILGLRRAVRTHLDTSSPCCGRSIFAFDYGAEREPLMREVFRDFSWQPLRGLGLTFDGDVASPNRERWDDYRWDVLLATDDDYNGIFDFSGNNDQMIAATGPFKVFSARSSLVEFRDGITFGTFDLGATLAQRVYAMQFTGRRAQALFVNNGGHDRLAFTFRVNNAERPPSGEDSVCVSVADARPICRAVAADPTLIEITGLLDQRLIDIQFVHAGGSGKLNITKVAWRRN